MGTIKVLQPALLAMVPAHVAGESGRCVGDDPDGDHVPGAFGGSPRDSRSDRMTISLEDFGRKMVKGGAFIDVKAAFDPKGFEAAGYKVWRL
jgi:hypothetical protein